MSDLIKRYTDYSNQTFDNLYRISDNEQKALLFNKSLQETLMAPVYHFAEEAVTRAGSLFNPNERTLSKEEASELYGSEDFQFEEAVPESIARLRSERHKRKKQVEFELMMSSQNDGWFDHIQHAAIMLAGAAVGDAPLAYAGIFGLAGKGANYLAAMKGLKNFGKLQKAAGFIDDVAFAEKWGRLGKTGTRIFRNAGDNMVGALAAEMMLQIDQKNIGIDRTLADSMYVVSMAGLLGGVFGGLGAEAPIVDSVIRARRGGRALMNELNFDTIIDDFVSSGTNVNAMRPEDYFGYMIRVYDDLHATRRISLQAEANKIMKFMDDFSNMRLPSTHAVEAMLYIDNLINTHKPFLKALDNGYYDSVIPDRQFIKNLPEKELSKVIPKYKFMSFIEMVMGGKRTPGGFSLEKLNPVEALKLDRMFDKVINELDISNLGFKEFRDEILRIQKSLKGKRIVQDPIVSEDTPIKDFFKLNVNTRKDIAKLYYMLNPDDSKVFAYDELINLYKEMIDDDILTAFNQHKYQQELDSLFDDSRQAVETMKEATLDPGKVSRQAVEETTASIEQELKQVELPESEIAKEVKGLEQRLKDEGLGLPKDIEAEIKILDDDLKIQNYRLKAAGCLLNG